MSGEEGQEISGGGGCGRWRKGEEVSGEEGQERSGGGGVAGDGERDRQMEKSQRGRVEIVSMERL